MTWTNALEIEGAELVARTPSAPTVWFDPVAAYPADIAIVDNVVVLTRFGTKANGSGVPFVLEFGVRLPNGYVAANARVSVSEDSQVSYDLVAKSAQLQIALVTEGVGDAAVANMSADKTGTAILFADMTSPTAVGEIEEADASPILTARVALTDL